MKYNIKITTTSNFEGYKVEKYFDVITTHVIVGTNVFSDIAASWTDFFGGYSNNYQKKLSLIKQKAISNLKQDAKYLGANAIIGFSLDIDEISGKNTSMFMITAIGTPVILNLNLNNENIDYHDTPVITGEELDIILRKKIIKKHLEQTPNIALTNDIWEFIIENKYWEICYELISCSILWQKWQVDNDKRRTRDYIKIYLENLNKEKIISILYNLYLDSKISHFHELIYDIITNKSLFDIDEIIKLLEVKNEYTKYQIFNLIVVRKEVYFKDDIEKLKIIIELIKKNYPEIVQYSSQKKLLSSKESEIWICKCNTKNPTEVSICSNCQHDRYGFSKNQINPPNAIKFIEETLEIIEMIK